MGKQLRWSAAVIGVGVIAAAVGYAIYSQHSADASLLQPHDPGVVDAGQQIYNSHCASCHGVNLEGQPNWRERGPDGLLPAPPHDPSGHTWHHQDELLFRITKFGNAALVGGNYKSNMPGFGTVLDDAAIVAVLSYIKSTWPDDIRAKHDRINEQARVKTGG